MKKSQKLILKDKISFCRKTYNDVNLDEIGELKFSFTEKQVDNLVEMSTYNSESRTITLGKYNDKGESYIINAIENDSTYFSTGDEIWNVIKEADFSREEVWKLNEKVLDNAISEGKVIALSHNPYSYMGDESYFDMEIEPLLSEGYEIKDIGGKLYASK